MSKAEDYIREHTRHCSNSYWDKNDGESNYPWLTTEESRKAVDIAMEEIIEWIDCHWREYTNIDADGVVCFGHWKNDLRKAIKDN
jgi:hypothetical protein